MTLGPMEPGITSISTCLLSTVSVLEFELMNPGPFKRRPGET